MSMCVLMQRANLKVGGDVVGELEDLILLRIDGRRDDVACLGKGS